MEEINNSNYENNRWAWIVPVVVLVAIIGFILV